MENLKISTESTTDIFNKKVDDLVVKNKELIDAKHVNEHGVDGVPEINKLNSEVLELESKLNEEFILNVTSLDETKNNLKTLLDKTQFSEYQILLDFTEGNRTQTTLSEIYDERVFGKKWDKYTELKEKIADLLGIDYKKTINQMLEKIYDSEVIIHQNLLKEFNDCANNFYRVEGNGENHPEVIKAKKAWDDAEQKLHSQEKSMLVIFSRMPDSLKEKYKI